MTEKLKCGLRCYYAVNSLPSSVIPSVYAGWSDAVLFAVRFADNFADNFAVLAGNNQLTANSMLFTDPREIRRISWSSIASTRKPRAKVRESLLEHRASRSSLKSAGPLPGSPAR